MENELECLCDNMIPSPSYRGYHVAIWLSPVVNRQQLNNLGEEFILKCSQALPW